MADTPQPTGLEKVAEALNAGGERIKEAFTGATDAARDVAPDRDTTTSRADKDRTQTSLTEDVGDLAAKAGAKANDAADRAADNTREFAKDETQRVKEAVSDAKDSAADTIANAPVPGRGTQDGKEVEATGVNPGLEAAAEQAEKVEDVLR